MSLEKAKIGDIIYDVISIDEYYRNPSIYNNPYTAIKGYGDGYIYPIRSKTDYRPGFYPTGCLDLVKTPSFSESSMYSEQNTINFRDVTSLKEVIQTQQKLKNEEKTILTTIDNLFAPEIKEGDSPEMKAMKEAINCKHIDLDKYEPRFGPNYNNDKRLLRKDSITFRKLRDVCNALDIKATLTLEDASSDVPNPIGKSIVIELTSNSDNDEDDGENNVQ